jgi:hypothetical protein
MSSRPFQVKSSILPRPNTSVSGSASSKSSTLPPDRIGCKPPSPPGVPRGASGRRRANSTLSGAMPMCRCLECTTSTRNPMITASWASTNPVSMFWLAVSPSGCSQCPTICEAKAPCA